MAGYPAQIREAEAKLANLEAKLEEIDALKVIEPKLRREATGLIDKIVELKEASKADKSENRFFDKEVNEVKEAPAVAVKQAPAAPRDAEGERKAKLKAVNKKLKQIDLLKHKENLDEDARAKIATEPKLRKQLACLEAGGTYEDSEKEEEEPAPVACNFKKVEEAEEEESTAATVKLPSDPAEREKRVKNLKKKLQQIAKLKEKGAALDEEAQQKIDSEYRINQEVAALEAGKDEVTFVDRTTDDLKLDLDRRLKNVNKKLDQIKKLKEDTNLDADGRAKVASEAALKREAGELQRKMAELNKQERDRVAQRLGWEAEGASAKKKSQKK